MKTRTILKWLAVLTGILLYGCASKPKIIQIDPAFGEYISGYTSGMVTRKSNIRIELTQDLKPELRSPHGIPDSSVLEDIFSFEPRVKGKAVWVNERTIEFIPEETLPTNQFYTVEFDLDRVAEVKRGYKEFVFQFSTFQQTMFVEASGLRNYDDYNIEWQQLEGTVMTSDFEDTAMLKKTLTATQNGKKLPLRLESDYYENNKYYFYFDSVERKETAQKVVLSWNGSPIKSISKGRQEIDVPALGDFEVISAKVIDKEDQYVEIRFSEPIAPDQNLKGIVSIEGIDNLTYSVDYNQLYVYIPNRIVGTRKLSITNGIRNFKGYKKKEAYRDELVFEEPKPLVRIKGSGSILPSSNGLIFPFEAISLKSVQVRVIKIYEHNVHHFLQVNNLDGNDELTRFGKIIAEKKIMLDYDKSMNLKQWNKHVIDLDKLIKPDPGAIYRVSIRFAREDAICDCPVEEDAEGEEEAYSYEGYEYDYDPKWNEDHWHSYGFSGYDTWEYYSSDYSPCTSSYYSGKAVSRNILASDLGMIFKLDDDKKGHAFVSDMITTNPVANAEVQYFDYAKVLIASGKTDARGMLEVQLKEKPFLMVAKLGRQRGYLKLLDGYTNSLSKFDVEGELVQKGIKGFIYGERGVWRPGDSLYLTFIMQNVSNKIPPNHPVNFELHDPNGQIVYQVTKTQHVNNMYDFRAQTSTESPTGNYTAYVRVGNITFSKSLKVETVKPNRLKIYLDHLKADSTKITSKWLHGSPAKHLKVSVMAKIGQMKTTFDKYKNYQFDSPVRSYSSNDELIFEGNLNEKGEATFGTKLDIGASAPGMLRATYITKVFEKGGDFSIDRNTFPYSPFKTYVGVEAPAAKNQDHTLETGNRYKFDVVTVNEKGSPVATSRLQVKIYKIQWRWWYERGEEDFASYIARSGTIVMQDTTIAAPGGKGSFDFKINYPEYGRYLVTVTDLEGHHQTGTVVSVDWPYWSRANRKNNENANMLNFSCDKEKYTAGEMIKLSFPSPSAGKALVSIETRTKVLQKFWIPTQQGETVYAFPATAAMSPNAYVHVTLIQPHANTKNDLPIRMYGVVPVIVDDPLTHLLPEIRMPDELKPESTTTIRVKESSGRKMTYTLAIVDEGLLDLTNYKTPQPWNTFYAKEALGVKTWDMYDQVIGAYSGKLDKLLSIGGDGEGGAGKNPKASRFKPMVRFIGPFTVEAGQERAHQVDIPNYVGSVRVMVVGQNDGAYGQAEKTVAVKKPLMMLATLPRVLGPGETLALPVNVFAMDKNIRNVKVTVETNDFLAVEDEKTKHIQFAQIGDEVINFRLKVALKTGIAKLKITAVCGNERSVEEIEVDVRAPNPKVTEGTELTLQPGQDWSTDLKFKGILGTNKATIELSSVPSMGLEKRLDYLIQYPHGCIEQTTSAVFPQLFAGKLTDLSEKQKNSISANIKAALKRYQLFQTSSGGFSYWPGEGYENDWGSSYAAHFMIEAEKQGYTLPADMKKKWVKFQQQKAKSWSPAGGQSEQVIQAYRLFVLALSSNAELGAMNRLREEQNLSAAAKWRLAAAYKLVGQDEIAAQLINKLPVTVTAYRELSFSYGSEVRDRAMILETLSLMNLKSKAEPVAKQVAAALSSDQWMSTQETAYSLLAMCEYAGVKGSGGTLKFSYKVNGGKELSQSSSKTLHQLKFTDGDFAQKAPIQLKNTGNTTLYVKVIVEGVPLTGDQTTTANNLKLTVKYVDMEGRQIKPDKLKQGTEFKAVVTVYNPGKKGYYKEMALTQIFPSGWEIHNSRMDEDGDSQPHRYQDIRDDRVLTYYDLGTNETKTFTVKLTATYQGRFYLPTLYSEAMYDHLISAQSPGRWVEVSPE